MKMNRMPTHVGVFFREEFVKQDRIKVLNPLSYIGPWDYMGITYCEYLNFLDGNMDATEEMLRGLEELTGIPFYFWRNMQGKYNEWVVNAKATVKDYFKDGVVGNIEGIIGEKQKVYICIKLGEGVSHTTAAYTDRDVAEKVSQAWGDCPIVEAEVDI